MVKTLNIFAEFEKINRKMRDNNGYFGVLGRVDILFNPDKDVENYEPVLLADHRIGFADSGDAYIKLTHRQQNFPDTINMSIVDRDSKPVAMIETHFMSALSPETEFSLKDAGNHPFVLSWRRFLEVRAEWLETEDRILLAGGDTFPALLLSVEDGIRLMSEWVAWLQKYCR